MPIPEQIIDQIQERTDIVEVIGKYVALKKSGRNYKANCPFHHEKTPSFMVSPDKQIYHCFGCGAGGNVFSFLMRQESLEFPEVVEMLAEKAGVRLPRMSAQREELHSLAHELYAVNEQAAQFFEETLGRTAGAREYLQSRGLGEEAIKTFKIGYAIDSWDALIKYFAQKKVAPALLEKAGLIIPNDRGGYYDRFRRRLIFPIVDLKGKILGFGGRVLDASLPKYMNSPETCIYSKGRNLYGLPASKEHIKKSGYVLIVEGYFDFLVPYQAGIRNVVATLGTALTVDQVRLLKRFTKTIVIVYDPDAAGEAASLRNLDLFLSEDCNVYIAELAAGYDPDSFIKKFGADEFKKFIKSSKNVFDYKIDKLLARTNINHAHGKAVVAQEMLPTIARISNAVIKSDLVKKLAERLGVDEESIRTELRKVKPDRVAPQPAAVPVIREAQKNSRSAEKMIVALLCEGASFVERVKEALTIEDFENSSIQDIVKAAFALAQEHGSVTAAQLMNHLAHNEEAAAFISEAVSMSEMLTEKEKALSDCIARIKKDNLNDQVKRLQEAIKAAHRTHDEAAVRTLVAECNGLLKKGDH